MGLELLGVIDPDLNWKTITKGRRSAVRRARTSFIGGCSKDIAAKENMGDVSISESEKVGVSILGQRFNESLRSVPIKKRRLLLSPSRQLDYSEDFSTSQMVSSQEIPAYEKHRKRRLTSRTRYSFQNTNGKTGYTADFSGISILAAAACNSDIVGDIINAGGFNSKGHSSMGEVLSNAKSSEPVSSCEEKVQHLLITENLERECSFPVEMGSSTSSVKLIDDNGLPSNKISVGPLQDFSDKVKSPSNPRLCWDLNTVMDAWEESCDEIVNCQPLATDHKVESSQNERNSVIDTGNIKVQTSCVSEFQDHVVDVVGSQMDDCVSLKVEIEKEDDMSIVKSSDSGEAKQSSVSCVYGNDEVEQHLDVDSVSFVGSNEATTPVNGQRIYNCSAENISPTDDAFMRCSFVFKTIEKLKSYEVSKSLETEPTSILVYGENSSSHSTTHKPHYNLAESTRAQDSDENFVDNESTGKSIVESNSNDHCLIDSPIQHFNLNPRIERKVGIHNSDYSNEGPSNNHLDDRSSKELVDDNVCANKRATCGISNEIVPSDGLVIARKHHADESMREASRGPCLPSTHCCDTIESSDNEILTSHTSHGVAHKVSTVDQKAVDSSCSMFTDKNLVCTRSDFNGHDSLKASIPMPSGATPLKVDDVLAIRVESKCYLTSYVNSCEGCGLNDNLGCTSDHLVIARKYHTDKSIREVSREPCVPSTHCCDTVWSSDNEILASQTAHDGKHEMGTVDQKAVDSRCAMFSDANLVCTKSDCDGHNSLKAFVPMSTPLKVDADMVDDVSGVEVESKCFLTGCKGGGLDDNLDYTAERNSASDNANQANPMQTIHFLEYDDSQYEDGEFRGSILHDWGDAPEEVEMRHLDCVSNNKEIGLGPPNVSPVCLPLDGMTCNNMQLIACDGVHLGKDMEITISEPLLKCSSISDRSDAEYGKSSAGTTHMDYSQLNGGRKSQRFVDDASVSTDNVAGYISYDRNKEASTSTRMKLSGWNQMPETRKHNREKVSDLGNTSSEYHSEGSFDAVASRFGSSFRRDLTSRVKRISSSDKPRGSYVRESRYNGRSDIDVKAEVDVGAPNLSGKYGPSRHSQGRDSGERWFEPSNHCVKRNHDSSPYNVMPGFTQSGSRSAAAAAVAKAESNGFVVAPDGTIIKASGVGPGGRLPRRSTSGSLHASCHSMTEGRSPCERNNTCDMWKRLPRSREMSPVMHFTDECHRVGRYNHEIVRNQYNTNVPDNGIQLELLHLPRTDGSLSPRRANPRLSSSHSRSPRSRTRSPCNWTSHRGRTRVRMNRGPVLRRRSRSPLIFNSDTRMKTMGSPHRQPDYRDRMVPYDSRIYVSIPHAQQDSRKGSPDHFRELDYRQNSGSTATMRMIRNQRFNSIDSQGRLKPDDHCTPLPSRRASNLAGFNRGSRQDGLRDRRVDGYEMAHFTGKRDMNAKHGHYNVKERFQNNSTGFQRMGKPEELCQND